MYLMRLDDASEYMNIEKWTRMERLLDKYNVKPVYGIIPSNKDPDLLKYGKVNEFWELMIKWKNKGWIPALHGYTHVFETNDGGINPVNPRSEFAGLTYERQCEKIKSGCQILQDNNISPKVFFAPAHTFDINTIKALKEVSSIRIIIDTIADDIYFRDGMYFIPQQSGQCRKLPFNTVTFCYHPNIMKDCDYEGLELFLKKNESKFARFEDLALKKRAFGIKDVIIKKIYFARRLGKNNE